MSTLIVALVDGGDLRIDALGRLWIEKKVARRVVSNLAGQQRIHVMKNRKVVRFRTSRRLVATVNGRRIGDEPELVRERALEAARDARKSRGRAEDG